LADRDVQNRPEPNLVRYRWTRTGNRALAGGRFTAELVAPLHSISAPFTAPQIQP